MILTWELFKRQESLQRELGRTQQLITNDMKFIKCQILHLRQSNTGHKFKLGEEQQLESNLGVIKCCITSWSKELIVFSVDVASSWVLYVLWRWASQLKNFKVFECIWGSATKLVKGVQQSWWKLWKACPVRSD